VSGRPSIGPNVRGGQSPSETRLCSISWRNLATRQSRPAIVRASCEHPLINVGHGTGERPRRVPPASVLTRKLVLIFDPTRSESLHRAVGRSIVCTDQQGARWPRQFPQDLRRIRRRPLRPLTTRPSSALRAKRMAACDARLLPAPRPHNEAMKNRAIEEFWLAANVRGSFPSIGAADPSTLAGEGAAAPIQCATVHVNRRLILSKRC
jgi:hypothetical protein